MHRIAALLALLASLLLSGAYALSLTPPQDATPCTDGSAAGYPCDNVELLAHLPLSALNPPGTVALKGNDLWGWADPVTGAEWALVGQQKGVAFVDVSDPLSPTVAGFLPTATDDQGRQQRDIKVYRDHAYVVSEAPEHGMQIVDLSRLPEVVTATRYSAFGNAHNLVINETSGFAYAVGTTSKPSTTCNRGLHIIDLAMPAAPTFAGCYDGIGYVHDARCVTYPADSAYPNREICFLFGGDEIAIVDVTDKGTMQTLARVDYEGRRYAHQGWLTEDRRFLLVDDELDETLTGINTTTYIWNVEALDAPRLETRFVHDTAASDHNLYIQGRYAYLANYQAGLRVLDVRDPLHPQPVGFFDLYPEDDEPGFNGAWTAYPFLPSGTILLNGRDEGLFLLRFHPPRQPLWLPHVAQ